ncbi:hypothetical protein M422DRAFT_271966 [Sphaerobolus stellatus SS14]|uniref:Uncharacterized protein n=1 Tax=Sphaerobolus stellatus (strain SS14) TaxID=990650 RepID=A0A0C9TYG6_SPHS4|nr:hypothetical protein M422DRAFT_271966 [Sphaerobolus stellatus SS14]
MAKRTPIIGLICNTAAVVDLLEQILRTDGDVAIKFGLGCAPPVPHLKDIHKHNTHQDTPDKEARELCLLPVQAPGSNSGHQVAIRNLQAISQNLQPSYSSKLDHWLLWDSLCLQQAVVLVGPALKGAAEDLLPFSAPLALFQMESLMASNFWIVAASLMYRSLNLLAVGGEEDRRGGMELRWRRVALPAPMDSPASTATKRLHPEPSLSPSNPPAPRPKRARHKTYNACRKPKSQQRLPPLPYPLCLPARVSCDGCGQGTQATPAATASSSTEVGCKWGRTADLRIQHGRDSIPCIVVVVTATAAAGVVVDSQDALVAPDFIHRQRCAVAVMFSPGLTAMGRSVDAVPDARPPQHRPGSPLETGSTADRS